MVKFNRQLWEDRLEHISPICRVSFAVSVAERLYPVYVLFFNKSGRGNAESMRVTLDYLWDLVLRKQIGNRQPFLDEYESLFLGDDGAWSALDPLSENAVVALAYACQCQQQGDAQNAAWAAVQGYEAVDYIAHTLNAISFSDPDAESVILTAECVQAELQRQLRDMAELEMIGHEGSDIESVVDLLRNRAKSEGITLLPFVTALCER